MIPYDLHSVLLGPLSILIVHLYVRYAFLPNYCQLSPLQHCLVVLAVITYTLIFVFHRFLYRLVQVLSEVPFPLYAYRTFSFAVVLLRSQQSNVVVICSSIDLQNFDEYNFRNAPRHCSASCELMGFSLEYVPYLYRDCPLYGLLWVSCATMKTKNLGFVRQRCMGLDPTEENDSYDIVLFSSEFKKEWL